MIKLLRLAVLIAVLATSVGVETADAQMRFWHSDTPPVFRNLAWGMSKAQVVELEGKPIHQSFNDNDDGVLIYNVRSSYHPLFAHLDELGIGFQSIVRYYFQYGRLMAIELQPWTTAINHGGVVEFYNLVRDWLEQEYGEGIYGEVWENDVPLEGDIEGHLWEGRVVRMTAWLGLDGNKTNIVLLQDYNNRFFGASSIETVVLYMYRWP